jgi:DNA-binding CsgD family transcriptional regulator
VRPTADRRNARSLRDRQAFEDVGMRAGALFAAGHSQAEVARELGIAARTSAAGMPNGAKAGWRRCAAPARPDPPPRLSDQQLEA